MLIFPQPQIFSPFATAQMVSMNKFIPIWDLYFRWLQAHNVETHGILIVSPFRSTKQIHQQFLDVRPILSLVFRIHIARLPTQTEEFNCFSNLKRANNENGKLEVSRPFRDFRKGGRGELVNLVTTLKPCRNMLVSA